MKKPKPKKPKKKIKAPKKKPTWRDGAIRRMPNDPALVNDD